ncbi:HNH endonuclease [bacterium]|jgi:hypothetical protein|nr:HNH endonuclease [bacterium]
MELYNSSSDYLFNLQATSSSDAKRMWRQSIKDKWKHKCAYCESTEYLTIDHIVPQSKGGSDFITNVLCCCRRCNNSKSHINWEEWYSSQDFFTEERYDVIVKWMNPQKNENLYRYNPRRNNAT